MYINTQNTVAGICGGSWYMIKEAFQISGGRLSLSLNGIGTTDKPFGKRLFLRLALLRA